MANQWHYTKGDERIGPVSSDDLKQLAASGELKPDDLIWKDGLEDWKPASQLKGLFPESPVMDGSPSMESIVAGGHSPLWQIPLMVAAMVLISSMFVPWWSFRIKGTGKEINETVSPRAFPGFGRRRTQKTRRFNAKEQIRQEPDKGTDTKTKKFAEKSIGSFGWYIRHVLRVSVKAKIPDDPEDGIDINGRIWGWNLELGLGAALLGFFMIPVSLAMMFSSAARRFSWVTSFLAAYASMALMAFVLAWFLDTPGFDFKPIFYQGTHFGPYLVFGAGALIVIFGLLDGILGLREFSRKRSLKI